MDRNMGSGFTNTRCKNTSEIIFIYAPKDIAK